MWRQYVPSKRRYNPDDNIDIFIAMTTSNLKLITVLTRTRNEVLHWLHAFCGK
jgi:hypothetical protein